MKKNNESKRLDSLQERKNMDKKVLTIKNCLMVIALIQLLSGLFALSVTVRSIDEMVSLGSVGGWLPGMMILGLAVPFSMAAFTYYAQREFGNRISPQSFLFAFTALCLGIFTWGFPVSVFGIYLLLQPTIRTQYLKELLD